jgi:hypothetical protein
MYSLPKSRDYYRAQVKLSKLNYMDLSDALKQSGNLFNQSHESRIFVWAYFLINVYFQFIIHVLIPFPLT